ncbi:MAG: hypothetical protein M3Z32_06495, partial [Acidobacteriota bacterium]|nr:hypothetical protein [Acidobacteriota bacterium]
IALAFYIAVRVLHNPAAHRIPLFLLGMLTSAAFFSKMQSVPIVASIGAAAIAFTCASCKTHFTRPVLLFVAGLAPLQVLNAIACLASGVWKDFWFGYLVSNQRYIEQGSNIVTELPRLVRHFVDTPEVGYFIFLFLGISASFLIQRSPGYRNTFARSTAVSALVIGVLAVTLLQLDASGLSTYFLVIATYGTLLSFILLYEKGPFGTDPVRWFGLLSTIATGTAVFSVYRPHRSFPHYLLLLFLPLSAAMAWMLIRQTCSGAASRAVTTSHRRADRFAFPFLFAALAMTHATFLWGSRNAHAFRTTVASIRPAEGDFIRSLTSPGGRIFVWGWTPDPYLGSGRVPSTRDLNLLYHFLAPEEISSYYRKRTVDDLTHDPPELIVYAIGPASWFLDNDALHGFDQVPEVAAFVKRSYRHIADAYGERFFLRADLAARAASVTPPQACSAQAVQCEPNQRRFYPEGATSPVMEDLPAVPMPKHALMEVQFTPFGRQTENATILNNEAVPRSFLGYRFQNMGGDNYRLLLGVGDRWVFSKPILLAEGKTVWLSIEFADTQVTIRANGAIVDTMQLPATFADAPGPITIGSWIDGACRFSGTIQFFQIVDLSRAPGS